MDDDNRFWFLIASLTAGVAALFIGSCTVTTVYADKKIAEEVLSGVDPILSRCAHYPANTESAMCASRKP